MIYQQVYIGTKIIVITFKSFNNDHTLFVLIVMEIFVLKANDLTPTEHVHRSHVYNKKSIDCKQDIVSIRMT